MKKGLRSFHGLALAGLCCLSVTAHAQTTTAQFNPARDNTLYERPMGDVSNGSGTGLFFGQTGVNAGNVLRRAVMAFDLSTIPPGSQVTSVSLTVTVDMVPPGATGFTGNLHRLTADWGEGDSTAPGTGGSGAPSATGDATWIHRFFDTDNWTTAGGDFAATPSASLSFGAGTGPLTITATGGDFLTDIQSWVDQPQTNFGWILLGEETNPQNARRIGSRENAGAAPLLTVEYTPAGTNPPAAVAVPTLNPVGLVLLLLGILALMVRQFASNRVVRDRND